MQTHPHLLLIEDNRSIASALCEALQTSYRIDTVTTGKAGLYRADGTRYDAILLDLQLPDIDGLAVCQQLRERGATSPVIIISAEAKTLSKINLLDAGANDYLTKPFSLGELKARLRVLLRASEQANFQPRKLMHINDLTLDPSRYEVHRNGTKIALRKKEFLLLECLMTYAGNVVSRKQLIDYAWLGSDKPWANTIDVHIKFLRDKVDRPFGSPMIQTVHGVGYRLLAEAKQMEMAQL